MAVIPQKELRNNVGAVLRRIEAGETLTVTVAGRVVAELRPVQKKQWVSGTTLSQVWHGPAPQGLEDDLARLGAEMVDPFA
jgi:antitoxin (DNA-binding transcriptional repressor) of toxin-antitoxin stability system